MTPAEYGQYGQDIRDRSFRFACRIVEFCAALYRQGGVARCAISLKESRESKFRLRVVVATRIGPPAEAKALAHEAEELAAILGAIVRNARHNAANHPRPL
jgi:hypothetical protein